MVDERAVAIEAHGSDRRADARAEVAIWVQERTRDALYYQRATNLSLGGVFLDGTLPHPPGTLVELDLEIAEHDPIRVEGEVVGRAPGGVGMAVRFVGLDARARMALASYLDRS
jgi:uncharacterized protein (TIGR02266 family)